MLRQCVEHRTFISEFDDRRLRSTHEKALPALKELLSSPNGPSVETNVQRRGFAALQYEELYAEYTGHPRTYWNDCFIEAELRRIRPWAKQRFAMPLTDEQLRAIIIAEDNSLVVAGAGTGKTTTVLGRIVYLVELKETPPERILVLAFNKDAAAEVRARLEHLGIPVSATPGGKGVLASTYHALGGNIAHEAGSIVRKKVSSIDEDPLERNRFIRENLLELFRDTKTHAAVRDFLAYYTTPIDDARDYPSHETYVQSESASNLRTLKGGKQVKSHGERFVANWLFLHGIDYQYEKQFEFPKGNSQNQRYLPDFSVTSPRGTIYIEYYGLDEHERTAPGIDRAGYLRSRQWKRALHKTHGTHCIELTYAQLKRGELLSALSSEMESLLESPLSAIPISAVEKIFIPENGNDDGGEMALAIALIYRFLTLYRSNLWTLPDIEKRMRGTREQAFLRVFKPLLDKYLGELDKANETDFAGLIADAVPLCKQWPRRFDHVIVDEFQDISRGRELFLRELLDLTPGRRFCAVGDDWQSIYRFTGSDVTVMTGFDFGSAARTDLESSFRFNESLLALSSQFIQKNPAQLRKRLLSKRSTTHQSVYLCEYDDAQGPDAYKHACLDAVKDYQKRFKPNSPEVLFLSRYRNGTARVNTLVLSSLKGVSARSLTVHSSKGLEADCVIVEVPGGRMGFPCSREDDPLIRCVLTNPDSFSHAEERRLFYVALTRARTCVYLVAPTSKRSVFISELLEDFASDGRPQLLVDLSSTSAKRVHRCPLCRGHIVGRVANAESFWSCENSPACYFTTNECSACNKAPLLPSRATGGLVTCSVCGDASHRSCPACKIGILLKRTRRADSKAFWGCSLFSKTGCSFTTNNLAAITGSLQRHPPNHSHGT